MKTIIYRISIMLLYLYSTSSFGQVVIHTAEKFAIGNTYTYWKGDTAGFSWSGQGQNITWDFSNLQKLQAENNWQVLAPSQTQHPNTFMSANEVRQSDNVSFFLERKTDSVFLRGFVQNSPNIEIHYTQPQLFAVNPIQYGDSFVTKSLYTYSFGNQNFIGGGRYAMYVDGEGKLIVDGKTYENVLRVRIEQHNADTIKPFNSIVSTSKITTYRWYNKYSGVPLLTVDSVSVQTQGGTQNSVEILGLKNASGAVAVKEQVAQIPTAAISYDQLTINGIDNDAIQQIEVFNMAGQQVATGSTATLQLPKKAEIGELYFVSVQTKNNAYTLKLGVR